MRRKMKIKREYYDQVGTRTEKVEVYGSHRLCRHIEEDHTVKGIRDLRTINGRLDRTPPEISDRTVRGQASPLIPHRNCKTGGERYQSKY